MADEINRPRKIDRQSISADVTGQTMTDLHLRDRDTVIVICDEDDGVKVYFRGRLAAPVGKMSNGSPLQWLWHLAYHLTTIDKRINGDESDVTDHDVDMTLVKTMFESPLRSRSTIL